MPRANQIRGLRRHDMRMLAADLGFTIAQLVSGQNGTSSQWNSYIYGTVAPSACPTGVAVCATTPETQTTVEAATCHEGAGHPSIANTPQGLRGGMPSAYLLAGGCVNCHSQVHGSNHPSGSALMRQSQDESTPLAPSRITQKNDERLFTLQNGYTGELTSPWLAADTERFWNVGVGARWVPQERWTLELDYLLAPSHEDTDSTLGGLTQGFPQSWTKLDSTHFEVEYKWTAALQVHFRYTRETYNSNDWAIDGVGSATVSNLLSLGAQPYRDNVNVFGLTVRYQFDAPAHATQNSK